jgi:hypothetical protein
VFALRPVMGWRHLAHPLQSSGIYDAGLWRGFDNLGRLRQRCRPPKKQPTQLECAGHEGPQCQALACIGTTLFFASAAIPRSR